MEKMIEKKEVYSYNGSWFNTQEEAEAYKEKSILIEKKAEIDDKFEQVLSDWEDFDTGNCYVSSLSISNCSDRALIKSLSKLIEEYESI